MQQCVRPINNLAHLTCPPAHLPAWPARNCASQHTLTEQLVSAPTPPLYFRAGKVLYAFARGAVLALAMEPTDSVRILMAADCREPDTGEPKFASSMDCATDVYDKAGVSGGFFKGYLVTLSNVACRTLAYFVAAAVAQRACSVLDMVWSVLMDPSEKTLLVQT